MTDEQVRAEKNKIDAMTQMDMARLWRFAPNGHPYFDTHLPLYEHFAKRFKLLGGFTPIVSKTLGWVTETER